MILSQRRFDTKAGSHEPKQEVSKPEKVESYLNVLLRVMSSDVVESVRVL